MDILTDYRITALVPSDRELGRRAERARVALERAAAPAAASDRTTSGRPASTASLPCLPAAAS